MEKRHFHPVPDVWSLKSEKIKYREDLELSEYVRSFLLSLVEAELLAVEVRVFKAFVSYFFNCGPEYLALARMISPVNLKKWLFMQLLPSFRSEPLEPEGW